LAIAHRIGLEFKPAGLHKKFFDLKGTSRQRPTVMPRAFESFDFNPRSLAFCFCPLPRIFATFFPTELFARGLFLRVPIQPLGLNISPRCLIENIFIQAVHLQLPTPASV
jgi:hypothetical protein